MLIWVFAYDIVDDRARRYVAKTMEAHATRVQKSVFEGRMSKKKMKAIVAAIEKHMSRGDSLRVYPISEKMKKRACLIGGAPLPESENFWLL